MAEPGLEFQPPDRGAPAVLPSLPGLHGALDALRERLSRLDRVWGEDAPVGRAETVAGGGDPQALLLNLLCVPSSDQHPDPGTLFTLAVDAVARLCSADRAMLFVAQPGGGRLVPRSAHGFRREDLDSVSIQPGEGIVGRAFVERRVLTDAGGGAREARDAFIERFRVREAMAVPIRVDGEVAGVLYAGRRRPGTPFSANDVLLLLVVADRVGGGLAHQAVLDRRARHLARLGELSAFAARTQSALPVTDVLASACDIARRLLDVRAAAIAMATEARGLELVAAAGLSGQMPGGMDVWRRVDIDHGLTAELYAGTGCVACRDLTSRPVPERTFLGGDGFRGCLLLPLRQRGGDITGVLYLADTDVRDFSEEEIEAARVLASMVESAIENSRVGDQRRGALEAADPERLVEVETARALGEMAGGLARELSDVFATILGKSRLLLARAHDEPLRESLGLLEEAAWRGADVVQRLTGLAAPTLGEGVGPVDISALVEETLALTRPRWKDEPEARGARIDLATDLGSAPPVRASAPALRDAVTNVVLNAVDAMPRGGRLSVTLRPQDAGVQLAVEDTGEGMSEDARRRAFDPFFTTRSPKRMGLGLTVAHGVVTRYGGRIEISASLGGGTRVMIWLPGAETKLPAAARDPARAPGRRPPEAACLGPTGEAASILVLEHDAVVLSRLADALSQAGYRVETAVDGPSGLGKIESGHFDVVLADLALPERSGLAIARAVRSLRPLTPVVLITGWGRLLDPERLREHGVDLMLLKPFRAGRALSVVRDALRLRASPDHGSSPATGHQVFDNKPAL